jgi:hypothetical protein
MKNGYLLLLFIIIFSCKNEKETIVAPPIFEIEKEFRPYFNRFIKEAALRNIFIDTTNLILKVANTTTNLKETCGTCFQFINKKDLQKTIEINAKNEICWTKAQDLEKETLIFHELGHCLLGRTGHKNDLFGDKSPKSIMNADGRDLYIPCVYAINDEVECNKTNRRKYYLDELFDPKTPTPSWAK